MDLNEIDKSLVQNESVIEEQCNNDSNVVLTPPATQPIVEVLGSTYNSLDGGDILGNAKNCQQVRTSARVFKKMKLDNAQAIVTSPIVEKEKKEVIPEVKIEIKRQVRPLWGTEDKDAFFEGLNEHGRDFDAIHQHINRMIKRKGLPSIHIKTKEQVRHFYTRSWHKVSKHLKFTEDIKKIAQELYGLINYGELRRKVGSVSEKTCLKLNELMYKGTVVIRNKGRNIRVKTPMCRALRKLNQLDEKHEELKLPTRVIVELRPKNMETWLNVQFMSQNPRIRLSLTLQRRLSTLLNCLNDRWKTQVSRAHEKAHTYTSTDCASNTQSPALRLAPRPGASVELPTIDLTEFLTSCRITFSAYEERIGVKVPGEQLWPNMFSTAAAKGGGKSSTKKAGAKRQRNESTGDKTPCKPKEICDEIEDNPTTVSDVVDTAINTILSLQMQAPEDCTEEIIKEETLPEIETTNSSVPCNKEEEIEKIKSGWTLENCGTLTIGELYLMFGHNSKLELQYSWDPPDELKTEPSEAASEIKINKPETESEPETTNPEVELELKKTNVTETESKTITTEIESEPKTNTNKLEAEPPPKEIVGIGETEVQKPPPEVSITLKKLLSLAKLHYRKERIRCPCGHICGGPKANSANRNKNVLNKTSQKVEVANNPQNCMRNVTVKTEPMFRKPEIYPLNGTITDSFRAQLASLQTMRPKCTNRKGRPVRAKHVVVERMLPLLPKPLVNGHSLVTMKVISQIDDPISRTKLRPIAPRIEENPVAEKSGPISENTNGTEIEQKFFSGAKINNEVPKEHEIEQLGEEKRVSSPTSISNFLNLELQGSDTTELISGGSKSLTSFAGLLSDDLPDHSTPMSSPSRILKENDNQWLNSEVNDYSLTSLLGHLESPMKTVTPAVIPCDDTPITQDIDSQFPSLLGENGVDFVDQFVDMAAQVNTETEIGLNG